MVPAFSLLKCARDMRKRKYLLPVLFAAFGLNTNAQECGFEVNAGPDIEVCNGGSVQFNPEIKNAVRTVWRGGKGQFIPNRETANAEYIPSPEEAGKNIVLTLVADDPSKPDCKKERDDVVVKSFMQPSVDAGENLNVCFTDNIQLNGKLNSGQASRYIWTTNGSGTFSNKDSLNAVYHPSESDLKKGGCSVQLKAIPYGVCLPDSDAVAIVLKPVPDVNIPAAVSAEAGKTVTVAATIEGKYESLDWNTDGAGQLGKNGKPEITYLPSSADAEKGEISLILHFMSPNGCKMEKKSKIKVSLPGN